VIRVAGPTKGKAVNPVGRFMQPLLDLGSRDFSRDGLEILDKSGAELE